MRRTKRMRERAPEIKQPYTGLYIGVREAATEAYYYYYYYNRRYDKNIMARPYRVIFLTGDARLRSQRLISSCFRPTKRTVCFCEDRFTVFDERMSIFSSNGFQILSNI